MRRIATTALLAWLLVAATLAQALAGELLRFDADERMRILAHGPWPPPAPRDPSNRVSGQPAAIAFGEVLFHSARLSTVGGLRCASCHEPWRSLTDGRARSLGAEPGSRNTPSLFNVGLQRSFGWDGANDSLWAQSIRPLLDPTEMRASAARVAALVRTDPALAAMHAQAFGGPPKDDDDTLLVDVGKSLAAFEETLLSAATPFDRFRDALARGDVDAASSYELPAQRGLRVFVGRGRCAACHSGATFSDGGFHLSLIVSRLPNAAPDRGHEAGVESLRANPYNLLGRYNDSQAGRASAEASQAAAGEVGHAGAFRTPGLREVAMTAPYMHDGSVDNLCDALQSHAGPGSINQIAPPLSLAERRDLVAFLRSLSARRESPLVDEAVYRCQ